MAKKEIPNIAIIGAGFISEYHVKGIQAAGGGRICCLVGRQADSTRRRAEELGIAQVSTDLQAVLGNHEIDAVIITSPDWLHRDHAIASLRAGKSVLLQKPMALDTKECSEILDAAERAGLPLTVSFMHRYFSEVRWLRTLLESDALGNVHNVRIRNATPGADWADWFYTPGKAAGGVVMQLGVHGIDLCQHLFGPIVEISARTATAMPRRRLKDGREITSTLEDNAIASYRLASGTLVSHEMSYTEIAGCDRFRLELYAEKGTVWLRTERGNAAVYAPELTGKEDWVTENVAEEPLGKFHHQYWLDVISGRSPCDDTAEAGRSTTRVAEAIYKSHREGQLVAIDRI